MNTIDSLPFTIDNTFTSELTADSSQLNVPRQVFGACYSYVKPTDAKKPILLAYSVEMAESLGLSESDVKSPEFLAVFSGQKILKGTNPYAMCYGGHQFGQWAGQLGDGRAINLFEVVSKGKRWQLQLKGAGKTPYSRSADGLAVLRSSIREYLCSEAMYHLGVPTTRALSLMLTGDQVLRDVLYDGHPAYEKGAVVCRVAPTFIRFGNFQILASRQEHEELKKLTDYTIKHFFPHLGKPSKDTYLAFFSEVSQRTLDMIVHWQRVGFVHGVMNTDNMSILGQTIDYGPYGWLDDYDPNWTPNTTDAGTKRYRYAYQPTIAQWNLLQLANALYPLIEDDKELVAILHQFKEDFEKKNRLMMLSKLGLTDQSQNNQQLIERLQNLLPKAEVDMTLFFRLLSGYSTDEGPGKNGDITVIQRAFYNKEEATEGAISQQWKSWIADYCNAIKHSGTNGSDRAEQMNKVNPKYVLRNYMAQMAIDQADKGDYDLLHDMQLMLKKPYDEQPQYERWFAKRPDWARDKVGCSMLSCSS